jgi:hypothetical protein
MPPYGQGPPYYPGYPSEMPSQGPYGGDDYDYDNELDQAPKRKSTPRKAKRPSRPRYKPSVEEEDDSGIRQLLLNS